jgi:predicted dinucleotide-binding enzyme
LTIEESGQADFGFLKFDLALADMRNAMGAVQGAMLLQAMRIGDLGIAAIPCEVFAETAPAIKQQSIQEKFMVTLEFGRILANSRPGGPQPSK